MSIGAQHCPACLERICSPSGRSKDFLIIGNAPDDLDMQKGQPFSSSLNYITSGKVMRKELERVGLSLTDFRVSYLWLHEPNKNENCWTAGYEHILDEAKGKKAILLVGADVVDTFTDFKVSDVSGLRVDSALLSAPLIMACVSPGLALNRSFGEFRFSIERWKINLEKEGLI